MAGHGQGRPAGAAARSKGATGGWEAFRRCYLRIFWGGTKVVIVAFERIWLILDSAKVLDFHAQPVPTASNASQFASNASQFADTARKIREKKERSNSFW